MNGRFAGFICTVVAMIAVARPVVAQSDEFEVASIRRSASNIGPWSTQHPSDGRFSGQNLSARRLILQAFNNAMDVTLAELAEVLERQLDRIVRKDTGIDGVFDFKLTWTPSPPTDLTGPSIFTAIQEQYGLRLAATKGPVEMTVIDRVERPSGN